jgi:hypothetical protein
MTHRMKEPPPYVPGQPPPPEQCVTAPPATLAEALVIIEGLRQQLEAWRKIDAKDEEIIHKADEGKN